ncbi:MAG: hypothetical protein HON04_07590 [Planctomicrobium sp.]|nr:hypothetical protein [Planctomicrobium sp.]
MPSCSSRSDGMWCGENIACRQYPSRSAQIVAPRQTIALSVCQEMIAP